MRKHHFTVYCIILLSIFTFFAGGCLKDKIKSSYTYKLYTPVYKTLTEVRNNMKSNPATGMINTGKLYIKGNYIFLNEFDKGIHVIDNSNPTQPRNIAFIDIPGNEDIAVKGS